MRTHPLTADRLRNPGGETVAPAGHAFLQCPKCSGKRFFVDFTDRARNGLPITFTCADTSCAQAIKLED